MRNWSCVTIPDIHCTVWKEIWITSALGTQERRRAMSLPLLRLPFSHFWLAEIWFHSLFISSSISPSLSLPLPFSVSHSCFLCSFLFRRWEVTGLGEYQWGKTRKRQAGWWAEVVTWQGGSSSNCLWLLNCVLTTSCFENQLQKRRLKICYFFTMTVHCNVWGKG